MSEVVAIRGATLPLVMGTAEPNVVDALKLALAQAESGEIVALAIVKVKPNGNVGFCWESPNIGGHSLIAGCSYLMHDLLVDTSRVVEEHNEG